MSILIKGMDIPSSCQPCKLKRFAGSRVLIGCKPEVLYECPFCDGLFALKDKRNPSCKFEQLPTPHGRLIDGEKVKELLLDLWKTGKNYTIADIIREIVDIPTIIEAEE